jgi:hypothetical protein
MKWSLRSLEELNELVTYLKKSTMGIMLENFANYYISKHMKHSNFENYSMNFDNDVIDPFLISNISDGEYKLAFICELIKLHCKKKNENIPKNVYEYFANMLRYCLRKKFHYPMTSLKIDYNGYYLISLLQEHFKDYSGYIIPHESHVFHFSYYLIHEIMSNNKDISLLISLISHAENLDISLLDFSSRRSMYEILKTKRTLYLRFLLVLTFEILKAPNISNSHWIGSTIHFSNRESFTTLLTSPLIETIIFCTSYSMEK